MSLITDLLSKIKHRREKSDIPPGLKKIVSQSAGRNATIKRIALYSLFLAGTVVAGFAVVYFVESYGKQNMTGPGNVADRISVNTPVNTADVKKDDGPGLPPANDSNVTEKKNTSLAHEEVRQTSPSGKSSAVAAKASSKTVQKTPKRVKPVTTDRREDEQHAPKDLSERDVYLYAASSYENNKDFNQALSNYKKALENSPNSAVITNNISGMYINVGSYPEAITYARKALELRSNYVPALINLSTANIRLGNLAEGERYLFLALSIEPSNRLALYNCALLNEQRGEFEKALDYFTKLSMLKDARGIFGTARILEKQGKLQEAIKTYREILAIDTLSDEETRLAHERLTVLGRYSQ
jgi:tetratricopeptide (TPR) repeat protein